MKKIKENMDGILFCLLEIVIGILLLINPVGFTSWIIVIFGVVLTVMGIAGIVKYFRADPYEASLGQGLTRGLLFVLMGVFCIFKSHWFIVTFPVLSVIYGVLLLVTGFGKIQWTCDIFRQKRENGLLTGISAVITIVCAIIILKNPFATTTMLWRFTGISMIVEAVIDLVILIWERKK